MSKQILLRPVGLVFLLFGFGYGAGAQSPNLNQNMEDISCIEACHKHRLVASPMRALANAENIDVKYHRFRWTITPSSASIRGSVFTRFQMVAGPANVLEFDLTDTLIADSARYHNQRLAITRPSDNVIRMQLPASIPMGSLDTVEVFYHGNPPSGGGFGSFIQARHNGTDVIWTLSEPYGSRDWWPCKQDLSDKIDSIDTYVNIPTGNRAAGNGKLVTIMPLPNNRQIYYWKHRYPIPAYLVCTAVTNYIDYSFKVKLSTDSLLMQNYFYPEYSAGFKPQVEAIKGVLQLYDTLFGPYPYMKEKYGHAQFNWGGGMEHTTMSFMTNMEFSLQAHELGHQWFGDKVTCGSWRDIWLNEGFASYMAALAAKYTGRTTMWEDFLNSGYEAVSSSPGGSVFVDDTSSVNRIFSGRLSYTKGAWLLHMLRFRMGDSAFYAGLQGYMADPALAYGFARTPDLQRHLEAASGQSLTEFFKDWLYGEGVPSYVVSWRQGSMDSVSITLNQSQSSQSVSFFETPIPLRITYRNATTQMVTLNNTADLQTFMVPTAALISRIDFDPEKWILTEGFVSGLVANAPRLFSSEIKAFPNPASTVFTISGLEANVQAIRLLDLSGREVALIQPGTVSGASSHEFNLPSTLSPGTYSIQVSTDQGRLSLPLTVIR